MKQKAKTEFIKRLDMLVNMGRTSTVVQPWQYAFLDGLTEERDGITYYRGVRLNVTNEEPAPTTLSR